MKQLNGRYYTVTEAANAAGVTVGYVRQLLRKKTLTGQKIGPRAWILAESQVAKLKEIPSGIGGRPRISEK